MAGVLKHWRESATIMLIAKTGLDLSTVPANLQKAARKYDYKLLMLKRSSRSKFMPNAQVFPGGVVHDSDFSKDWLKLVNPADAYVAMANKPPMLTESNKSDIPAEVAYSICAIRETFEEAGVLLCRNRNGDLGGEGSLSEDSLSQWRDRVNSDASNFLSLCQTLKLVPDLQNNHIWSDWLTPIGLDNVKVSKRRFDTLFYLYGLPFMPDSLHCSQETVASQWTTPVEILYHHNKGDLWIAPPQEYELRRLCNFQRYDDLVNFAAKRVSHGVQRWLPVRYNCRDGVISVVPGDSMYPEHPDIYGDHPVPETSDTLEESRTNSQFLNRMVFPSLQDSDVLSNVLDPCGHKTPLSKQEVFKELEISEATDHDDNTS